VLLLQSECDSSLLLSVVPCPPQLPPADSCAGGLRMAYSVLWLLVSLMHPGNGWERCWKWLHRPDRAKRINSLGADRHGVLLFGLHGPRTRRPQILPSVCLLVAIASFLLFQSSSKRKWSLICLVVFTIAPYSFGSPAPDRLACEGPGSHVEALLYLHNL
jgi:hypothetical protein